MLEEIGGQIFMADAKKCDRCGKYYDENYHDRYVFGNTITHIKLSTDFSDHNYKKLDLCDDCFDELYKFLGIEEEWLWN